MTKQRIKLGCWGEKVAAGYLRRRLYRIVATNYRNKVGEIDIIARRGGVLAFVEVKTRTGRSFGSALEAVNQRKQQQIIRAAQWYLAQQWMENLQPRFDVIAVQVESNDKHSIEHIKDAFAL